MRIEESVHYNARLPENTKEWEFLAPYGEGRYRTTDDQQFLFSTMIHQIHCVQMFANDVIQSSEKHIPHVRHCLNFLREMALCRPDLTLEPGDFTKRNFTEDRHGAVHQCRDWQGIHDVLTRNYLDWYMVKMEDPGRCKCDIILRVVQSLTRVTSVSVTEPAYASDIQMAAAKGHHKGAEY